MSNYVTYNSDWDYYEHMYYVRSNSLQVKVYHHVAIDKDEDFLHQGAHNETACDNKKCPGEKVVYMGYMSTAHFGNFLIDYLSRLWYVVDNPDCHSLIYTAASDIISQNKWMRDILSYLGITKVIFALSGKIYESVVVPEPSFIHDGYIHPQFRSIYDMIYKAMPKENWPIYDKIYLTRAKLKRQKEIGEWRFDKFFNANGYTSVALETMPLAEQAWIMRHAQSIASLEGTHAHAVVWREEKFNGKQIVLRKQSEVIPRQMMLNQLWNIKTDFVDVFEEPYKGFPISHDRGPFLLRWTEQMEKYATDHGMEVPDECRKGYWNDITVYTLKCIIYRIKHSIKHILRHV